MQFFIIFLIFVITMVAANPFLGRHKGKFMKEAARKFAKKGKDAERKLQSKLNLDHLEAFKKEQEKAKKGIQAMKEKRQGLKEAMRNLKLKQGVVPKMKKVVS